MKLPDGRLVFATPARDREVCGTVQALGCRCGGAITLTGSLTASGAPLYYCLDCGTPAASLFAPQIVPVGEPHLGPFGENPTRSR